MGVKTDRSRFVHNCRTVVLAMWRMRGRFFVYLDERVWRVCEKVVNYAAKSCKHFVNKWRRVLQFFLFYIIIWARWWEMERSGGKRCKMNSPHTLWAVGEARLPRHDPFTLIWQNTPMTCGFDEFWSSTKGGLRYADRRIQTFNRRKEATLHPG